MANLNDLIGPWQDWLRSGKRTTEGTQAKYLQQVRRLIRPGAAFPSSDFTRSAISQFLNGLELDAPNRYRAALSSFGRFLVEREILKFNPVRDVQGAKEADSRCRYLERADAQRLIGLLDSAEARAIHALMCGTGMEIGAALATRHRDVSLADRTVQAHGTKRASRDRSVKVTEPWCFEIFESWVRKQAALPAAPVFTMKYDPARSALQRALVVAAITDYTSHDWRHTYAVQALRDGLAPQVVARQLGHPHPLMVHKVYGRYVPNASDYEPRQTLRLTVPSGDQQISDAGRAVG